MDSPTAVLLLGGIGGLVGPDVDGRLVGRCVVALVVGGAVGGTVGSAKIKVEISFT